MRSFLFLIAATTISACSTNAVNQTEQPFSKTTEAGSLLTTGFTGSGIKLFHTKNGEWEKITSTASAPVIGNVPSAKDSAITVATLKAKRQISEFLNSDIKSNRTVRMISDSLEESEGGKTSGENTESVKMKVAQTVTDSIATSSRAILNGLVVESEYVDADKRTVTVVVVFDRKAAALARQIQGIK